MFQYYPYQKDERALHWNPLTVRCSFSHLPQKFGFKVLKYTTNDGCNILTPATQWAYLPHHSRVRDVAGKHGECSRNNAVIMESVAQAVWCLTTGWTIGVRSPTETEDFSSSPCVQTGSGAHPASCPKGTGGLSPGVKRGRSVTLTT
jgi:hypothetical protein